MQKYYKTDAKKKVHNPSKTKQNVGKQNTSYASFYIRCITLYKTRVFLKKPVFVTIKLRNKANTALCVQTEQLKVEFKPKNTC